ncbi:erythromycin esterase family protein [Kibdelosporangium persicum]|nr:erythromycin esterase family protein [Kibdelosporangium persicum]
MGQSVFGRGLVVTLVCAGMLGGASAASAGRSEHPVTGWVTQTMAPLDRVDPAGSLDDLAPLRESVRQAQIVGLGESVHGASEELRLKHRVLRVLVEQLGFRSIAWEDQWTTGVEVDEYISGGAVDLGVVLGNLGPMWQNHEVADVLLWLRDFNKGRADKVRFVGVEYYLTGLSAYDAVDAFVARTAPERLAEVRAHLRVIRPASADIFGHIAKYQAIVDKQPFITAAQKVHDLVTSLPHKPGDRAHALAVGHARQIKFFYEHYSRSAADGLVYRDARAAENLRWWRDHSGDKVAYWAASPHVANAPHLRIAIPPDPDMRFASAGSYLRDWYGRRYVPIGFTFDHGTVSVSPGETVALPAPPRHWFEWPLGAVRADQFAVDLRVPAPPEVRSWLRAPIVTRGLPDRGPGSYTSGGSVGQWFDVIVHRQKVTPAQPV